MAAVGVRTRRCAVEEVEFSATRPALWLMMADRHALFAAVFTPARAPPLVRDEL